MMDGDGYGRREAMPAPLALIFDVDGTLAETESAHREAFNEAFAAEGLSWHWSEELYARLLAVGGGRERMAAYFCELEPGPAPAELIDRVHARKTRYFAAKVEGGRLPLRPGVQRLLEAAKAHGLPLAIATTTTPANVDALLRAPLGERWRDMFAAFANGATAHRKKPDPQVYLQVLEVLGAPAGRCLAFEDSHIGLRAALAAGVPTIITPTPFTADDDFAGALRVLPDLGSLHLDHLLS
jgi:HAD superfamily hydrolase (TIGR01509 family)